MACSLVTHLEYKGESELQSVHDFVVPTPHVQTAPLVQTMPNLDWTAPSSSAPSSAAASAQPTMSVTQMRGVQRSQPEEPRLPDGNLTTEDVYHHRQQQQQGGVLYVHIYIYMYAVESITGPSLGVFKVNNWSKFVKKNSFCKKQTL